MPFRKLSSLLLYACKCWLHSGLSFSLGPLILVQSYCLLLLEYMEQGALFDFLHQNEFDSNQNLMWAKQVAAGKYTCDQGCIDCNSISPWCDWAFICSANGNILSILLVRYEISPLWCPRPSSDSWGSELKEWYSSIFVFKISSV